MANQNSKFKPERVGNRYFFRFFDEGIIISAIEALKGCGFEQRSSSPGSDYLSVSIELKRFWHIAYLDGVTTPCYVTEDNFADFIDWMYESMPAPPIRHHMAKAAFSDQNKLNDHNANVIAFCYQEMTGRSITMDILDQMLKKYNRLNNL